MNSTGLVKIGLVNGCTPCDCAAAGNLASHVIANVSR
jgi:hypothetical protein